MVKNNHVKNSFLFKGDRVNENIFKIVNKIWIIFFLLISTVSFSQIVETFEGDRFTQYSIDDWISYAPALYINAIDMDEKYVYFATQHGGILRIDKYRKEWGFPYTTSSGLRSNNILDVVYNQYDGNLYARTPYGIDVLRFGENYWQKYNGTLPQKKQPELSQIAELRKGKDYRFPPYFRPQNDFLPNLFSQRSFVFIPPDQILDNENREYRFTDRITDEWQRLWLGTNGFGPMMADMNTFSLYSMQQSIPNISVRDLYLDKNKIWIGGIKNTNGINGITAWNDYDGTWQYFEEPFYSGIAKDDVFAIDGNQQCIIFATIYGIVIYDKNKSKWKTYTQLEGLEGEQVNDVLVHKNTVYIATENGFNWMDLNSNRAEGVSGTQIDNVEIRQISVWKDTLYLATKLGLYRMDLEDKDVQFISSRSAIPDFNLTSINAYQNEIWIGNSYGIAYKNLLTNSWSSFPDLSIKPQIRDIAFTNSAVWFATDKGLMKFNREMNSWRLFTTRDGLINNNVYHIDVENDNLWLSTDKGFTIFHYNRPGRLD